MRSCCLHFVLVGQEGFQNVKKGKVRAFETLPANTSAVCLKYTQKFSEEGEKWCLVSGSLCSSGASRLFDFHASGKTLVYAPCVVYDRAWPPEGLWPPRAQTWPVQRPSAVGGARPHGRLRPPLTDGGRKPRCSNWYVTVSDQEMLRNRKESSTLVSMYRDFVINICPRGMYFYNRSGAPSNSSVLEESNNRCL